MSDEAAKADAVLAQVKAMVTDAAGGDPVLLFALRRRLFSCLMYWERSTPAEQTKLKAAKHKAQRGLCAICDKPMDVKGSELDRADPVDGYTADNTRLVHYECHRQDQEMKGFRQPVLGGPMIENHAAWLIVGGFTHVGDWRLKPNSSRAVFYGDAPKEAGVYAYLIDGVIFYVGSAQIGIRVRLRRYVLADNKRTSMRVRQAIEAELRAGRTVEVFTIVPEPINYRGLPIDPVVGLEEGLIRFVKPEWNLSGLGRTGKTLLPQVGSMPDIDAE